MLKKLNNNKGFTIIEVMIVLAIAGLIILIVLLAVPALQRNGRNTAIKNDASAIAAALSEFASNNDGKAPTAISSSGSTITVGASTDTQAAAKVQGDTTVTGTIGGSTPPTAANPALGTIVVHKGVKCGNVASARALSVYYSVETSSGQKQQCVDA